ncbi:hypothetical protein GW17_00015808 [Ensete ventricosum]|nr:hypothetical protein GW17_00015808 [Ensete ventricosum]
MNNLASAGFDAPTLSTNISNFTHYTINPNPKKVIRLKERHVSLPLAACGPRSPHPLSPRVAPSVVVGWLLRACSRGTRGEGRRAPRRHPSPRRCSPGRRAATPPHDRSSAAYPDATTVHVLASPPRFLAGPAGLTGWLAREGLRSLYADISISSILPERPYGGPRR